MAAILAFQTLVGFRFENELLKRIDAYGKRLEEEMPGLKLARVDVVRILGRDNANQVKEDSAAERSRNLASSISSLGSIFGVRLLRRA